MKNNGWVIEKVFITCFGLKTAEEDVHQFRVAVLNLFSCLLLFERLLPNIPHLNKIVFSFEANKFFELKLENLKKW